jgi:hypothetical protein
MEASADLHDVRDCLGHAHITTTSRYVRSTPVRLAQALARMEAAAETLVDADDQPYLAAVRGLARRVRHGILRGSARASLSSSQE